MSYAVNISTMRAKLPAVERWNHAIAAHGFDMTIHDLAWDDLGGVQPVRFLGKTFGIEMGFDKEPAQKRFFGLVRGPDSGRVTVSVYFHSSMFELAAGSIALVTLAQLCDGVYSDDDGQSLTDAEQLTQARTAYVRALLALRLLTVSDCDGAAEPALQAWESTASRLEIVEAMISDRILVRSSDGSSARVRLHNIRRRELETEVSEWRTE